jgi:hypothetical protein
MLFRDPLVRRIVDEYTTAPHLQLSGWQVCKLFQVDEETCRAALTRLETAGALSVNADGTYVIAPALRRLVQADAASGGWCERA